MVKRESIPTLTDHFHDLTKMIPLTLEQLRGMDGQPVWIVESPDGGHWELSEDAEDYVMHRIERFYGMKGEDPEGKHGLHKLGWLAYAYPPANIDREALEPCGAYVPKIVTNADRIRAMSDEELARFLSSIYGAGTGLFGTLNGFGSQQRRTDMDYKEQIDRLRSEISELENSELAVELFDCLITDLLARAEAAEARCETLEKMVKEYQDTIVPGYRERAEKAEREAKEAQREVTLCRNGWKKAERERDGFKAKYIEAVNRACELSKIVDDHGWEE